MAISLSMPKEYWAAAPNDEIVKKCQPRIDNYYDWMRSSGRYSLWSRVHRQYYAGVIEGGALGTDGDQDELISMNVNDFRNLGRHLISMITAQRPHFEPKAVNADHKSQTQTILAQGILDYVLKEKNLENVAEECLEMSLLQGDAWIAADWDATAGREYSVDPDGQSITKTGDLVYRAYGPMDMVRDFTKGREEEHTWYIARHWVNRYDLAARYPEHAEKIIGLPTKLDPIKRPRFVNMFVNLYRYDTEDVEVFDLYHDRTPALPDGRKVTFVLDAGDMPPLFDGPLPYDDLSLYRMTPAFMHGTSHGYSPLYDLLSLQEAENALWSTLASNISTFGVQNILVPLGSNLDVNNFGGLKIIKYDPKAGPPQGLNLVQNSPDTYKLLELVTRAAETISGINSVARGNPESSLKSGAALALIQSQAIQFSVDLQKGWVRLLESTGTGTVRLYRRFAEAPQVAELTGAGNRGYLREFTRKDLDRISRVTVDLGNALQRTVAGRVQIAELLGQKGLLKTPEEYIQVLTTGRLEPVLEASQKEMLAIKAENEKLSEGASATPPPPTGMPTMSGPIPMGMGVTPTMPEIPAVIAMITDNHPAHIREHAAVVSSPESRETPAVVQATLQHIQQHVDLWQQMPPAMAMALQIPPPPALPPPPGAPVPGPGPGGPPPQKTEAPPSGGAPEPPPSMAPQEQVSGMPTMPQMPMNPLTGERAPGSAPQ